MTTPPPAGGSHILRVSIVLYAPDKNLVRATLRSLIESSKDAIKKEFIDRVEIFLVNNGPAQDVSETLGTLMPEIERGFLSSVIIKAAGNGENIGFGAGHNLTFDFNSCEFHLILNPDVEMAVDALANALKFMYENHACGMLSPEAKNDSGDVEYLCKRYPAMIDLALRGFAPAWLRDLFRGRLSTYEMRDKIGSAVLWEPPIISGCFMLMRASTIKAIGGFDPRFFLYFEDFDLSLRVGSVSRIAHVPSVKIVHHGGHAAKKGWRHIYLFTKSGIKFFNKHGWKWM
jgi:GT2 family glycosyltransferase